MFEFVPTPPIIHVYIPLRVAASKLNHGGYGSCKKKKRTYQLKAKKSNVRASLLTKFQAAIAYACYDSPSLLCGATSMTDAQ